MPLLRHIDIIIFIDITIYLLFMFSLLYAIHYLLRDAMPYAADIITMLPLHVTPSSMPSRLRLLMSAYEKVDITLLLRDIIT